MSNVNYNALHAWYREIGDIESKLLHRERQKRLEQIHQLRLEVIALDSRLMLDDERVRTLLRKIAEVKDE